VVGHRTRDRKVASSTPDRSAIKSTRSIVAGTVFRLGEHSRYNFMQYVFFEKGTRNVQWGLGQSPRSWGICENFCVKSNLTVCKITFNCELQKKLGEQDVLVALPIILLGEQVVPPVPPVPVPMSRSTQPSIPLPSGVCKSSTSLHGWG